jgi:hypothetical protein
MARFTPAGFFASLHRQGVTLDTTPPSPELEGASADRWRRHRSMPGGLPTRRLLARAPVDRVLREVDADLVDPAAWATSRSRVLLDLSDAAACACGGNRAQVEDTQPSRNATPILVAPPGLSLRRSRPPFGRAASLNPARTPPARRDQPARGRPASSTGHYGNRVRQRGDHSSGAESSRAIGAPSWQPSLALRTLQ